MSNSINLTFIGPASTLESIQAAASALQLWAAIICLLLAATLWVQFPNLETLEFKNFNQGGKIGAFLKREVPFLFTT